MSCRQLRVSMEKQVVEFLDVCVLAPTSSVLGWVRVFCSLSILWPRIIMAKKYEKNIKALQLWFCGEIWIRRCRINTLNLFFSVNNKKNIIPVLPMASTNC